MGTGWGLLFVTLSAGCAFRTPTPSIPPSLAGDAAPPAHVTVAAVAVTSTEGELDIETRDAVRAQTEKILVDAARKNATGGQAPVVRADVELGVFEDYAAAAMARDGMAVFSYFLLAPAGVAFERQRLTVHLQVERDGRRFHGTGTADKQGSIYAPARKRALAVAIDNALADAARRGAL